MRHLRWNAPIAEFGYHVIQIMAVERQRLGLSASKAICTLPSIGVTSTVSRAAPRIGTARAPGSCDRAGASGAPNIEPLTISILTRWPSGRRFTAGVTRQCFNQRTVCAVAGVALRDQSGQRRLHRAQIGDFPPHIREMSLGDQFYLAAGAITLVCQAQQGAHLVEREAEFTRAADEAEALDVGGAIHSMAAPGARWFRQHADFFVEPDRLDIAPRLRGQRADQDHRPQRVSRFCEHAGIFFACT